MSNLWFALGGSLVSYQWVCESGPTSVGLKPGLMCSGLLGAASTWCTGSTSRARGAPVHLDRGAGQTRLLADTHVYDWWDWAVEWASATQQGWAQELMDEAALRALPRPSEMLAGAMDNVELVVDKSMSDAISCSQRLPRASALCGFKTRRRSSSSSKWRYASRCTSPAAVLVRPTTARFKFLGDNAPRLRARADSIAKSKTEPMRPSWHWAVERVHTVDVPVGATGVVAGGHVPCPPPVEQTFWQHRARRSRHGRARARRVVRACAMTSELHGAGATGAPTGSNACPDGSSLRVGSRRLWSAHDLCDVSGGRARTRSWV
ncbi:uncharacterized protein BXZ73DRAFT_83619 [Epithele typhae]|uniref:uncharacterized protein n=1 Tax=Epithele typhae TaxID=378194 RepID=UPI0020081468|nr:uncharacterized protein BXZ73DRAFT_83619 [Epithele typhae]KAH9910410.1 hypothetical protein BXZ73DRAFT_83619 [Epithele typhae]